MCSILYAAMLYVIGGNYIYSLVSLSIQVLNFGFSIYLGLRYIPRLMKDKSLLVLYIVISTIASSIFYMFSTGYLKYELFTLPQLISILYIVSFLGFIYLYNAAIIYFVHEFLEKGVSSTLYSEFGIVVLYGFIMVVFMSVIMSTVFARGKFGFIGILIAFILVMAYIVFATRYSSRVNELRGLQHEA